MSEYIKQTEVIAKRLDDDAYERRDKIVSKWTPIAKVAEETCGNIKSLFLVQDDGKLARCDPNQGFDFDAPSISDIMSSALWLYRIACSFDVRPVIAGPEGYKVAWQVTFKHNATGQILTLYDYKGGFSFGSTYGTMARTEHPNPAFLDDVMDLLNYLSGDDCVHPYDGVVAGSVA